MVVFVPIEIAHIDDAIIIFPPVAANVARGLGGDANRFSRPDLAARLDENIHPTLERLGMRDETAIGRNSKGGFLWVAKKIAKWNRWVGRSHKVESKGFLGEQSRHCSDDNVFKTTIVLDLQKEFHDNAESNWPSKRLGIVEWKLTPHCRHHPTPRAIPLRRSVIPLHRSIKCGFRRITARLCSRGRSTFYCFLSSGMSWISMT